MERQFKDDELQAIFQEAFNEVVAEEKLKNKDYEATKFDEKDYGVSGFETDDSFLIEQDISGIIEDVKRERDERNDGLMKAEKGTRKFATIPLTHIIEYHNKTGVDIMDADVSRDKWEMAKFRMWIQNNHPYLMVREAGKTRYNKTV